MAGFIKGIEIEKTETKPLNTKINKEVFDNFKVCCFKSRFPMNVVLEIFMQQYANGRFNIDEKDINKWKKDDSETDTLNTTFNKQIYVDFKSSCKSNGFFVKHVVTAFMEKFAEGKFRLEYVEISKE